MTKVTKISDDNFYINWMSTFNDPDFDWDDYVELGGRIVPKDCTYINKETGELELDFEKITGDNEIIAQSIVGEVK